MTDLRHDILHRQALMAAAMEGRPVPDPASPPLSSSSRMSVTSASDDEDDTYTPVHTRPGTPVQGPGHRFSRAGAGASGASSSTSRQSTPAGSRSSSPTRAGRRRLPGSGGAAAGEEGDKKASRDPLRRFENEISSRVFRELDVVALARCLRVSKRWHRSATINWAWYLRFQERRLEAPLVIAPVWTRRESKENWASRYRSAFTLGGLQYSTAHEMELEKARSDGWRTPKEQQQERWAAESAPATSGENGNLNAVFGGDKVAAREFYKSLGGRSKVKGKNTFGGSSGPRDRTAYGDGDDY